MLRPGRKDVWHTKKPPSSWQIGDRLFCWESSPALRVVGIAELTDPLLEIDTSGETLFEVRYLSSALASKPTITELRGAPFIGEASFLKSGPATTIQSISQQQAEVLARLIYSRNPELEPVWGDIDLNTFGPLIPDLELLASGLEGATKLVSHLIRERDRKLVQLKKEATKKTLGRLTCEVCLFDFQEVYGLRGRDFCEVHHIHPLSELALEVETRLEDLAIICSNCHRMLHRDPWITLQELRLSLQTTSSCESGGETL